MIDVFAIQQLPARYIRCADQRESAGIAQPFAFDAIIELVHDKGKMPEVVGKLSGREAIGAAMMQPHLPLGWSHHTMHDPLIEIDGDLATIDTQFITFDVCGAVRPIEGWPKGAFGAQGTITPIESGYYRAALRKIDGEWLFDRLRIHHDLPYIVPD